MQEKTSLGLSKPWWPQATRWLALGGVVGPLLFVGTYTLAGVLRPGYSPLRQTISDLGVGSNAWLVDAGLVINGLLLLGFTVSFAWCMRSGLGRGWRWPGSVLLALHGLGLGIAGIFTEAPATLSIHWLVGANLAFFGPVAAFLVVGLALRRAALWRGWGIYTLITSGATLLLVAALFWSLTPGSLVAPLGLGGLMERLLFIEIEAWYAAFGVRLFVSAGEH
jgi:hypothetical membrane protein